jgi:hypothetical protein
MKAKAKLTDAQIRAAHLIYDKGGLSLRGIAEQLWQQHGYASASSCRQSLLEGFIRLGLPRRDRVEAARAASTIHGRRNGDGYRRWLRQERGETRPPCAGRVEREDRPCELSAMHGSEYCYSHDPQRRAEVLARIASLGSVTLHPHETGGLNDGTDSRREGNPSRAATATDAPAARAGQRADARIAA